MKKCGCERVIKHGDLLTGRANSVKVEHSKECVNNTFKRIVAVINKHKAKK